MNWMEFVLGLLTLILGTGWIFTYRAYKKKSDGEATQAEAEGWKAQQDVYQQTIEDLNNVCEKIRKDRDLLMEENTELREENRKLREKYNQLENDIIDMRRDIAKQGRRLESLFPYVCGLAQTCKNRTTVEIQDMNKLED